MKPRISVIVAAYNAADTIEAALVALEDQTFRGDYEVLVVDDASTDATLEIARAVGGSRVQIVPLPSNMGRAKARNIAVSMAEAPLIVVADADDISDRGRLDFHSSSLAAAPGAVVSGGQIRDIVRGKRLERSNLLFPVDAEGVDRAFSKMRMGIAHPASAFRKSWFEDLGGYDSGLGWCEDYDLYARGWSKGRFTASSETVISYRRRTAVTDWPYWWENQRHHSAIDARMLEAVPKSAANDLAIDKYLKRSSSISRRGFEFARFTAYRAQLVLARGR